MHWNLERNLTNVLTDTANVRCKFSSHVILNGQRKWRRVKALFRFQVITKYLWRYSCHGQCIWIPEAKFYGAFYLIKIQTIGKVHPVAALVAKLGDYVLMLIQLRFVIQKPFHVWHQSLNNAASTSLCKYLADVAHVEYLPSISFLCMGSPTSDKCVFLVARILN